MQTVGSWLVNYEIQSEDKLGSRFKFEVDHIKTKKFCKIYKSMVMFSAYIYGHAWSMSMDPLRGVSQRSSPVSGLEGSRIRVGKEERS